MDQDKHKEVMGALSDLIRSQLEGEDRMRFACVKRLAVIGQKLMTEMSPRPEDAQLDDEFNDEGGEFIVPRARRGRMIVGGNDQQQMVREVMALAGPAFSGIQGQSDAKRRESVARELNELLAARTLLETPAAIEKLTKRIDAILAAMNEEDKKEGDEDELHVVPAVDVRRHQAGQNGRVIDAAYADGAVPDGEGRYEGALPAGNEAWGAPNGVGFGG